MAFDIGNGLSAAGTAVAATAGAYTLEAQKAELEKDKITMADALAGKRESAGRQEQGMINATAAEKAQMFQGGENAKQRASEEKRSSEGNATQLSVAGMQVGAQKYATDQRTAVEREALTPAEVRTAMWFSKASPDERKAFQNQLLIKSGLPAWAAGGSADTAPPAVTASPGTTVTPGGPATPVDGGQGSMDDTGAPAPIGTKPEKKADAGGPAGLPMPVVSDDKLAQVPQEARGTLKMMLEGRMAPPTSFAMSRPYWQTLIGLANQIDPTFDETSWAARLATRKDFTSGKSAVAVTAMNTALGHASRLLDKEGALNNFDGIGTPFNAPLNAIQNYFGDDRQGRAALVRDAMASEARKVFAATGGGGLKELETWEKNFNLNASPAAMKGQVEEFVGLLDSRLGSLSEQYNRGMGVSSQPLQLLTPEARTAYAKITGDEPKNATGYQTGKPPPSPDQKPAPVALPPANKRVIGRLYPTPTGTRPWLGEVDGKGWGPVQQSEP